MRSSRVRERRWRRENAPLVPGKGAVEGIFLSDQADVMLIYCSAVPAIQREMPSLTSIKLPATLTVEPADGMVILDSKPVALRFVAFVMSEEGQATLRSPRKLHHPLARSCQFPDRCRRVL
jgi:hypothetical protein